MDIDVRKVREHFELFVDNKFFCSGDSILECMNEFENNKQEGKENA